MAKLFPIHAVRYNDARAGADISSLIAPPYDVLDEGPKQALLKKEPHNIVAIDLPVTPPKTLGPDEAYTQAQALYQQWLTHGVLVAEPEPALYIYEQRFRIGEQAFVRRGLFATLQTEEYNQPQGIFRHEHTIRSGTDDRLKLMTATDAQLSPVFAVFDDADGAVQEELASHCAERPSFWGRTSHDDVEHVCWRITDAGAYERLRTAFAPKDIFVADGHHRYTTALNYAKLHPGDPQAALCLFALVPIQDPGVVVLPTHRVLGGLKNFSVTSLEQVLADHPQLDLLRLDSRDVHQAERDLPQQGYHAIALVDPQSGDVAVLRSRDSDPLAEHLPNQPAVWRTLDVAVLHELFIDRVLRKHFGGESISYKYHHDVEEVLRLAKAAPGCLTVIVQPASLDEVCRVAKAGAVMPPKSTYFFPKLATGLVINALQAHSRNGG